MVDGLQDSAIPKIQDSGNLEILYTAFGLLKFLKILKILKDPTIDIPLKYFLLWRNPENPENPAGSHYQTYAAVWILTGLLKILKILQDSAIPHFQDNGNLKILYTAVGLLNILKIMKIMQDTQPAKNHRLSGAAARQILPYVVGGGKF